MLAVAKSGADAATWWPNVPCRNGEKLLTVQIRPMRALYGSSSTRAVLLNSLKKKYISSLTWWEEGIMAAPANCGSGDKKVHFTLHSPSRFFVSLATH